MGEVFDPVKAGILAWLRHVHPDLNEEKRLKGDTGFRSTREVADRFGVTTGIARKFLFALHDKGLVEAFAGDGNHFDWRAVAQPEEADRE